ncbi:hypothetical protein DESC_120011 [Desulfosarcina cetonica]|nr:hypothetical protein DESC_120011 [Desulfosarcina cetonica]
MRVALKRRPVGGYLPHRKPPSGTGNKKTGSREANEGTRDRPWSRRADSNRGPADYESAALPAELRRPNCEKSTITPLYTRSSGFSEPGKK